MCVYVCIYTYIYIYIKKNKICIYPIQLPAGLHAYPALETVVTAPEAPGSPRLSGTGQLVGTAGKHWLYQPLAHGTRTCGQQSVTKGLLPTPAKMAAEQKGPRHFIMQYCLHIEDPHPMQHARRSSPRTSACAAWCAVRYGSRVPCLENFAHRAARPRQAAERLDVSLNLPFAEHARRRWRRSRAGRRAGRHF
jgi:hypothetical protein